MAWLAVNPDGDFKIFEFWPQRCKKPIIKPADYLVEDYHGHFYHPDIPTGEISHFWAHSYIHPHSLYCSFYNKGISIKKESLSQDLWNLTWNDEPVEI